MFELADLPSIATNSLTLENSLLPDYSLDQLQNQLPTPTAAINPLPDLIIEKYSAPLSVTAGSVFNLSVTVKNQGDNIALDHATGFYLSTDTRLDSSDSLLGYVKEYSSLNVEESKTWSNSVYIDSKIAPGNYYLIFQADNYERVVESNESNNFAVQTLTVTEAAKPDLTLTELTAPNSAKIGNTITIKYKINSYAPNYAGSSQTYFYLSKNTTLDSKDYYL